ncbi:hypothetical protein JF66_02095 [Cryobacterium sp. MLB-32]|uniref:hypothetical protein n=1 Tax=Cryobacterium sp. MLB-32 TaxID=1529318 RepID=UPI0004E7B549|nr:hypothetical protein [Cryobacterium sp. MLB-32]KFF60792.1 hypothetical protein JF66_02095 [Cryobacterium sp. MLB-32]
MKHLYYPGGFVLTGSELADAILVYAEALCNRRQVDVVDIPVVGTEGQLLRAQFLIGSASQLVSVTAESVMPELVEPETLDFLNRKAQAGAMIPAAWTREECAAAQFDEFDY